MRVLDDERVHRNAHGAEDEKQVGGVKAHTAEIHAEHDQHSAYHHKRTQPVGRKELLAVDDHRCEVDHQHVGFQKGCAGAQGAAGIAQICKQVKQEPENAYRNKRDELLFALTQQRAEGVILVELHG